VNDETYANLCPECAGHGSAEIALSAARDYETGEWLDAEAVICEACDGTGWLTTPITWHEAAPDLAQPRHTAAVSDMETSMGIETAPHPLYALITELSAELGGATISYEAASQEYAQAEYAASEAEHMLRITEIAARHHILTAGVGGKNETERNAALASAIQGDPEVSRWRIKVAVLADRRRATEACYREADQRQRSLRVRLTALAALVQGGAR